MPSGIASASMSTNGEIEAFNTGDEAAYERWVRRNDGYVLTERPEDAARFMLHEAGCSHLDLSNVQLSGPRRCARLSRPLREWANAETGMEPLRCRTCWG